jgi:hypothetical protein
VRTWRVRDVGAAEQDRLISLFFPDLDSSRRGVIAPARATNGATHFASCSTTLTIIGTHRKDSKSALALTSDPTKRCRRGSGPRHPR